ncbi:MAG: DUF4296 domain-containing protein [Bacteroidales bacterium]|nr:DUF4296 domain-containing protein [Bacteroidales bacterium]
MDGILKKVFWSTALCLMILSGCRPEGIIPPDEMVDMLTAFYEADAVIETVGSATSEITRHTDSLRVYGPIIERYGYTAETFRESLTWYLRKPDEIISIYDKVLARVTKSSDEAEKAMARLAAEEAEEAEEAEKAEKAEKIVEGKDKEDLEIEVEEAEPAPKPVKPDAPIADTVKPVKPVEIAKPAEPARPAVDTPSVPEKKTLRKKVTKKDLKRLEEGLK